jgi:hypothetical protein
VEEGKMKYKKEVLSLDGNIIYTSDSKVRTSLLESSIDFFPCKHLFSTRKISLVST